MNVEVYFIALLKTYPKSLDFLHKVKIPSNSFYALNQITYQKSLDFFHKVKLLQISFMHSIFCKRDTEIAIVYLSIVQVFFSKGLKSIFLSDFEKFLSHEKFSNDS